MIWKALTIIAFAISIVSMLCKPSCEVSVESIVFVNNAMVMEQFLGMKEATVRLKNKESLIQYEMDSISTLIGIENDRIKRNKLLSMHEKLKMEAETIEAKYITGAVNQLNALIEDYGKSKNYRLILGTTSEGSLLYGSKPNDVTKDLLIYVNQNYRPSDSK